LLGFRDGDLHETLFDLLLSQVRESRESVITELLRKNPRATSCLILCVGGRLD
jgi:hypothetical protein